MAPFHTPWETFAAWIVVGFSLILALIWAVWGFKSKGREDE